jgi:ADP-ribosyl-[dinitrogen reductase] hydrolase
MGVLEYSASSSRRNGSAASASSSTMTTRCSQVCYRQPVLTPGAPPSVLASTRHHARGTLVGLALGDALGAPVEFDAPDAIEGRREFVFSLPGGGPFGWAPGEFTDDTQMALVLARHLRDRDNLNQDELARAFAAWAKDAADVGNQTRTVLDAVSRGASWRSAIQRLRSDAAGNGSLMRAAPVALAAGSPELAMQLAITQSEVTHPSALCVDACRVFARLLWTTIETGELAFDELSSWSQTDGVREAIVRSSDDIAPSMSGYVLHTLTGALWAVRHATSYEDAVWRAVALGRDADTVAAVAGALAGARWGITGIPSSLSSRLQSKHPLFRDDYPAALEQLADELIARRPSMQCLT